MDATTTAARGGSGGASSSIARGAGTTKSGSPSKPGAKVEPGGVVKRNLKKCGSDPLDWDGTKKDLSKAFDKVAEHYRMDVYEKKDAETTKEDAKEIWEKQKLMQELEIKPSERSEFSEPRPDGVDQAPGQGYFWKTMQMMFN